MANIVVKQGQKIGEGRQFQQLFLRGTLVRTDVIYTDPDTGQKYRVPGVSGSAPTPESIRKRIQSGSIGLAVGVSEEDLRPDVREAVRIGRVRGRQEQRLLDQAKDRGIQIKQLLQEESQRLGVSPSIASISEAQLRERQEKERAPTGTERLAKIRYTPGQISDVAQFGIQIRKSLRQKILEGKVERGDPLSPSEASEFSRTFKEKTIKSTLPKVGFEVQDTGERIIGKKGTERIETIGTDFFREVGSPKAVFRPEFSSNIPLPETPQKDVDRTYSNLQRTDTKAAASISLLLEKPSLRRFKEEVMLSRPINPTLSQRVELALSAKTGFKEFSKSEQARIGAPLTKGQQRQVELVGMTAYGFGGALRQAREKPILTAAVIGGVAVGGSLLGGSLVSLGFTPVAARLASGSIITAGFGAFSELNEPGSVTTRAGLIKTGTEFGVYGIAGKGVLKGARIISKSVPLFGSSRIRTTVSTYDLPLRVTKQAKPVSKVSTIARSTYEDVGGKMLDPPTNPFFTSKPDVTSKGSDIFFRVSDSFVSVKPRMLLPQKTVGEFPKGSVFESRIRTGIKEFVIRGTTIGRQVSGTLQQLGRPEDILFKKLPSGKMEYSVLEGFAGEERILGRSISRFYGKESFGAKRYVREKTNVIESLDIGTKEGGAETFPVRIRKIIKSIGARADTSGFDVISARDVKKGFVGKTKQSIFFHATSGSQIKRMKFGDVLYPDIRTPSTIAFALNPRQPSNLAQERLVGTPMGIVKERKAVFQPILTTQETSQAITTEKFEVFRSRKKILKGLSYAGSDLITKMFPYGIVPLSNIGKTANVVKVPVQYPRGRNIKPTGTPPLSTDTILDAIKITKSYSRSSPELLVPIVSSTVQQPASISKAKARSESRSEARSESRSEARSESRSEAITRPVSITQPKAYTESESRTNVRTRVEVSTKVLTRSLLESRIAVSSSGRGINTPYPPPPTPGIPILFLLPGGGDSSLKRKRKKSTSKRIYQPTLKASGLRIFGRAPKILTGISLRPIPLGTKPLRRLL